MQPDSQSSKVILRLALGPATIYELAREISPGLADSSSERYRTMSLNRAKYAVATARKHGYQVYWDGDSRYKLLIPKNKKIQ